MATSFYTSVDLMENVPLTPKYEHTLLFSTKAAQTTYFNSKIRQNASFNLLSYQRHSSGVIRLAIGMNILDKVNYLRFNNASHEGKSFYAFVKQVNYVNDNCTEIAYAVDVIQTWMFDYTLNPCYIEREHASTDALGDNLIDEGLDTGDYIIQDMETLGKWYSHASDTSGNPTLMGKYFVVATAAPDGHQSVQVAGGIPNVLSFTLCNNMTELIATINAYVTTQGGTGNLDNILAIYFFPADWHDENDTSNVGGHTFYGKTFTLEKDYGVGVGPFKAYDCTTGTLKTYSAKNKKLLSYPYNFMTFEAPDGTSLTLRFENFRNIGNHIQFDGALTLFPYVETCMSPRFYECQEDMTCSNGQKTVRMIPPFTLSCKTYPTCGAGSDAFRAWWAQNKYSMPVIDSGLQAVNNSSGKGYMGQMGMGEGIGKTLSDGLVRLVGGTLETLNNMGKTSTGDLKMTSTLLKAGSAAISGDPSSLLSLGSSTADTIAQQLASYKGHQALPNTVACKANNSGITHVTEIDCYKIYYTRIKPQYAEIIDNYFTCFGYAQHAVRVPNITSRRYWNYIQTKGCTINGNVPSEADEQITAIYDRGITFWHDPSHIFDYSLDNAII